MVQAAVNGVRHNRETSPKKLPFPRITSFPGVEPLWHGARAINWQDVSVQSKVEAYSAESVTKFWLFRFGGA